MNKSPAFQFYASDFLVDTAEMTNQEIGAYIRLLSHQWVNGGLNSDPNRLANVVGIDLLEVWPEISHKFDLCEDGKLRNPKLEKVRQVQIDYRDKQSKAGKAGAAKRWNSNPNGNLNSEKIALQSSSSSSSSKDQKKGKKRFSPPSISEVQVFIDEKKYSINAESFVSFYESKNWYVGKNKMKCWKSAATNWNTRSQNNGQNQQDNRSRAKRVSDEFDRLAQEAINRGETV